MYTANRVVIDGIRIPDPAAIDHQRRREQPVQQPYIQPTVEDINEEGYRRWREDQDRQKQEKGGTGRGVIIIGGDDEED
jgi:hypothetical protein